MIQRQIMFMEYYYYSMQQHHYNSNQSAVPDFPDYNNEDDFGPWDQNDDYEYHGNGTYKKGRPYGGPGDGMHHGGPDGVNMYDYDDEMDGISDIGMDVDDAVRGALGWKTRGGGRRGKSCSAGLVTQLTKCFEEAVWNPTETPQVSVSFKSVI